MDAGFAKIFDLRKGTDAFLFIYSIIEIFFSVVGVDLKTTLMSLARLQNVEIVLMVKRDTLHFGRYPS